MSMYVTESLDPLVVNIGSTDDPFYRYKTRQLIIKQASKNRTLLPNLHDVAICLKTEPLHILTYLGYALGAKVGYDLSKPEKERAWISGTPTVGLMEVQLLHFMQAMIICPKCNLPELTTEKNCHSCRACGYNGEADVPAKFEKYLKNLK